MSGKGEDRELESYLRGDSELSQGYRDMPGEEPPDRLDQAILAAARREVRSRPHIAYSPFSSDWHVPVSIAAVLALCVTLVITIQKTDPDSYRSHRPSPRYDDLQILDDKELKEVTAADRKQQETAAKTEGLAPAGRDDRMVLRNLVRRVEKTAEDIDASQDGGVSMDDYRLLEEDAMAMTELAPQPAVPQPAAESFVPPPPDLRGGPLESSASRRQAPASAAGQVVPEPGVDAARSEVLPSLEQAVAGNRLADMGEDERQARTVGQTTFAGEFLRDLAGAWQGRAVSSPAGPTSYNVEFNSSGDCLEGRADNGLGIHTWRFCMPAGELTLDLESDFEGDGTPIHFRMTQRRGETAIFHTPTQDFLEVWFTLSGDGTGIRVLHDGSVEQEIELHRIP